MNFADERASMVCQNSFSGESEVPILHQAVVGIKAEAILADAMHCSGSYISWNDDVDDDGRL